MVTGFLCVSFQVVFPYVFPLQIGNALYEGFHSVCAGLFHLLGDVAIHVQREGSGVVAQVALHGFDVIPGPESCHGVAVAEIVEPRVRQTDRSREAFVVVIDRVGGKMLPSLIAEGLPLRVTVFLRMVPAPFADFLIDFSSHFC